MIIFPLFGGASRHPTYLAGQLVPKVQAAPSYILDIPHTIYDMRYAICNMRYTQYEKSYEVFLRISLIFGIEFSIIPNKIKYRRQKTEWKSGNHNIYDFRSSIVDLRLLYG